jgi:tetratricopeptide (TPR) repeat protein
VGDRAGEAATLNNMALVYATVGQPQQALALFEEALFIQREVGNRAGEASTLNSIAEVSNQYLNRPLEAAYYLHQAIMVLHKTGLDRAACGTTLEEMQQVLATIQQGGTQQ